MGRDGVLGGCRVESLTGEWEGLLQSHVCQELTVGPLSNPASPGFQHLGLPCCLKPRLSGWCACSHPQPPPLEGPPGLVLLLRACFTPHSTWGRNPGRVPVAMGG